MSRREILRKRPARFGFFATLRMFERSAPGKPRIGRNAVLSDEIVSLGQDPFTAFPAANITEYAEPENKPPRLRSRFLGFFGPQGALPLETTLEAEGWFKKRDRAYISFVDIFLARFLQLVFRVWSDARAITQFDRPGNDRFQARLGSPIGLGTPALREADSIPDLHRLSVAGLATGRVRSPVRLRQLARQLLGVDLRVEEHVPGWLIFEPEDRTSLGGQSSTLGQTARIGSRIESVNDRIALHLDLPDRESYERFLPGGSGHRALSDLLAWYLGPATEAELCLGLAAEATPAACLGQCGQLGRTAWITPDTAAGGHIRDASLRLA